ncbi:PQQ-binding-like beta-propeller repeat protein [Cellulomonas sp. Leaf334]|uniref:outer membrane protein assembly factor BamB family protein n=1 Tax=Cellulomonas sp. Leaf334 TaxID=1736339 RepID=UPI0006F5CB78|nr:PQQ-binding-like beta-propeller repeat protein [Cellulomonas sp. Leaf334]KQR10564.1 hypothetical protein ASF78_17990 [Cellulomonas sp. Leaf334]
MARPAPMQTVELVELDDDAAPLPAVARLSRADRWRIVRRWAPAPVALLLVLGGMQALDVARDRAALDALSEVPGVVRPVDQDVRVLWTVDEDLASLFWWDLRADGTIIGLERPADGSQALVSVDERTGERRWTTPLAPAHPVGSAGGQIGGCAQVPHVSGRVACLVSDGVVTYTEGVAHPVPGELSTVVVLDTADGSVVGEHPAPGAVAFAVLPDAAVVAVAGADDAVTLVATGLLDGEPRWTTTVPAPTGQGDGVFLDGSIALFGTVDGLGAVVSPGRMFLLDREGEVVRDDIDAGAGWEVDKVTRSVAALSVEPGGDQSTTFVGRDRSDVTIPGRRVSLSADDGSVPGLVLMSDSTLRAYDRGSPEPRWSLPDLRADTALVLRGRVYVSSGRGLAAVDAGTGEELWRTRVPDGRSVGGLVTDGRHLLSSQQRPDTASTDTTEGFPSIGELAAYRLDDGTEDWRVDLPDGLTGVWATGSTLLAWGEAGASVLG